MSSFEGNLAETPLNQVLLRVRMEDRTGVLTLQNEEDILAISLEDGRIVGADALNETLEEGLGGVLVGEGLITDVQFEEAAEQVNSGEGQIGDLLVDEGLLSRQDFLAALRRYTVSLVREVQTWESGEFRFYVGEDVAYEKDFEPIRMKEVLPTGSELERMRAASEEARVEAPAEPAGDAIEAGEGSVPRRTSAVAGARAETADPLAAESAGSEPAYGSGEELEDRVELPALQMGLRRVNEWLAEAPAWVARAAPLLVVVVLAVAVVWRPNSLVYPFFWLETERLELEKQRRTSVYAKIDRAAKTFFLLEGRFPDDLHSLVSRGLLSPEDIVGARGRILSYLPGDRGYVIRPGAADGTDPGVSKNEAIAGNFFLDPEFVIQPPDRGPTPLVLLD